MGYSAHIAILKPSGAIIEKCMEKGMAVLTCATTANHVTHMLAATTIPGGH